MTKYIPRLTAPAFTDKNYIHTTYGGKNQCLLINNSTGSVMPNCVGYAWGRFMEILGETPKLSCGDAGTWYGYQWDGYDRGQTAQLGAVICYAQPGEAGHVAIVEEIKDDGSIVISQSGYGYEYFWTQTVPSNYQIGGYIFQGFIYNPACSDLSNKFDDFINTALDSVGKDYYLLYNIPRSNRKIPDWNVMFVQYCASVAKLGVLANRKTATDTISFTVSAYEGKWEIGPHYGNYNYKPTVGDIVATITNSKPTNSKYYADRLGIVVNVSNNNGRNTIHVIEGDYRGKVSEVKYSMDSSFIAGYLKLNWKATSSSPANSILVRGSLYDEQNDENDALLREVAYIGKNQPLINMTDVKLSVINYTSGLATLFDIFGLQMSKTSSGIYQFTNPMTYLNQDSQSLRTNGSIIFDEFVRQGMPASAAVGVMSYMWAESRWNPAAINMWEDQPYNYRGRGLCQWSLGRAVNFVKAVPDWETNLTAQVQYCVNELKTSMSDLYEFLLSLKNTKEDAVNAAKKFTLVFGAGQPFGWSIADGEQRFKAHYGDVNWLPHIEPASYMWENNVSIML